MIEPVRLPRRLAELVGTVIAARYRIDALIGTGATGAVFAGHHNTLRRPIAIKALHPRFSLDPEVAVRFDREAQVAAGLQHANCCSVIDYGTTDNGCKYMVMPLLDGQDLASMLGRPMIPSRAVGYMLQILRGLKHAHDQSVVHRDLKPENLIVCRDHDGSEIVKITDFGIAKVVRGDGPGPAVTRAGTVPGTPAYMSPEHARGLPVDGRSDLYAAGLILYEMLAGRPAFEEENPLKLMEMQVHHAVPPLPDHVPAVLRTFVAGLLAKDPDERFFDALGALQALIPIYQEVVAPRVLEPEAPAGVWRRMRAWFHRPEAQTAAG